jgi:hypothetical protein
MQLNIDFNDLFGCPLSLDKVYVNPVGTAAEAVDSGIGTRKSTASLLT